MIFQSVGSIDGGGVGGVPPISEMCDGGIGSGGSPPSLGIGGGGGAPPSIGIIGAGGGPPPASAF